MSRTIPDVVAQVTDTMSSYAGPWALCGGWAIDAWLGETTRTHLDVDILIAHDDQRAIFEHLRGWHLAAHDAEIFDGGEGWDGSELSYPAHVHGRPAGQHNRELLRQWVNSPYTAPTDDEPNLEVVFDLLSDGELVLSTDPVLTVPWERAVATSGWGVPTVVPELLLFWKATAYFDLATRASRNPKDAEDFAALAPRLGEEARAWLCDAIALFHRDHAWLDQLTGQAGNR
ncbi:MAG TPA: hypothetical protein VIA81_12360 [Acidimicrobiia bacterium]